MKKPDDSIFSRTEPSHKLYGFGSLEVGDSLFITPQRGETIVKVRNHITSYAQYVGKKFKTKTVDGKLAVKRIA